MTQHDLEAPVERPVAELLERGPPQVRAGEPVVLEHELVRDDQARPRCSARSRSAAVWLAIVCSWRWRSEDTRA